MGWPLPAALGTSILVAALALVAGTLTPAGAVAAALVGAAVLFGLGVPGGLVLAVFFVVATAASRLLERPGLMEAKGARRDALQVLANGGVAAIASLATPWLGAPLALWVVTTALAAAAADTLATAFGTSATARPRHVLTREPVNPGTSGGVTLQGTAGGAAGAALVAGTGAMLGGGAGLFLAGTLLGWAWMLGDSILGASVQGHFRCPACDEPTERRVHRCGTPTTLQGGWRWLTNDGINLAATLGAALDSALWWWLFC